MINWNVDKLESGSAVGWEDSSSKHFRDTPINNLGREIIQNSLDAADPEMDFVKVSFKLDKVPVNEIPGIEKLKELLNNGIRDKNLYVAPKYYASMDRAKKLLKQPTINIMIISEIGTIGMEGPCTPKFPFYKYMKSDGTGQKGNINDAKGSHGLGKGAAVVCSNLNTIFCSTRFEKENQQQSLCMGRALFSSFLVDVNDEAGPSFSGKCYWGNNFNPIEITSELPDWLQRSGVGTNVIILGFNGDSDWITQLISSTCQTYFTAIKRGLLEVKIENYEINEDNIDNYFNGTQSHGIIKTLESTEDKNETPFDASKSFYNLFINPEIKEKITCYNLGEIQCYLIRREDNKKTIGLIRDEMFICLIKGYALRQFEGFDLLLEPLDNDGKAFLRAMEPPQHNKISYTYLEEEEDQKKAKYTMKVLQKKVRQFLIQHLGDNEINSVDINAFNDFFSMPDNDGKLSGEIDPQAGYIITRKKNKIITKAVTRTPDFEEEFEKELDSSYEGDKDLNFRPENPDNPEPNPTPTPFLPIEGDKIIVDSTDKTKKIRRLKEQPVTLLNSRIVSKGSKLKVFFTSDFTGKISVAISKYGVDFKEILTFTSSDKGTINEKNGEILIDVKKAQRNELITTIKESYIGSVSIMASKNTDI